MIEENGMLEREVLTSFVFVFCFDFFHKKGGVFFSGFVVSNLRNECDIWRLDYSADS